MSLTDEQKAKVQEWIQAGAKLSEIQDRMGKEMDIRMTYMDARLLVDDLKLTPIDPPDPEPVKPAQAPEGEGNGEPLEPDSPFEEGSEAAPAGGNVQVVVDQVTRAGAMVSGRATFSDGKTVEWYLDQYGRFGMVPPEPGYRPSQADLTAFQATLDRELTKLGM